MQTEALYQLIQTIQKQKAETQPAASAKKLVPSGDQFFIDALPSFLFAFDFTAKALRQALQFAGGQGQFSNLIPLLPCL